MPTFVEQAADAVEHLLALDRVRLHQGPLGVVERAGLVDDRVRDVDLADVVQERAELGLAAYFLADAHPLGDAHGEVDDVLGVVAGVLVVVLEQIAQQHRGAAVGTSEFDRLGDPRLALAREDGQQRDEREHEHRGRRSAGGREGDEQADGREHRVEPEDLDEFGEHDPRRHPLGQHAASAFPHRVGAELRRERRDVGRPQRPRG